jgi:hypothetical protein
MFMSAVRFSRSWASGLLLGVLACFTVASIVGCGGKKEIDPYVYTSLRSVMFGDTLSHDFLFEIDAPEFEYVKGNTGIVSDGNMLWFIVGHDLENHYQTYAGSLLGVQKFFKPQPYLMIKRVKKAGIPQPVDSVTTYVIPRLIPTSAIDLQTPGADLPGLRWNRQNDFITFVPEVEEGKDPKIVSIQSMIEAFPQIPRHDLADSVRANPRPEHLGWYAVFDEATLEIVDLTPGAEWMLEMLTTKDLPLVGSFSVKEFVLPFVERRKEYDGLGHVIGTMKINWFRFANSFVEGSAAEG